MSADSELGTTPESTEHGRNGASPVVNSEQLASQQTAASHVPAQAQAPALAIDAGNREPHTPATSGVPSPRSPHVEDFDQRKPLVAEELPPLLRFLAQPHCNPDFSDEKLKKVGFVERVKDQKDVMAELAGSMTGLISTGEYYHENQEDETAKSKKEDKGIRARVGRIVSSIPVQVIVIATIIFDMSVLIINFADQNEDEYSDFDELADLIVLIILGTEVLARLFWKGKKFFSGKAGMLNTFELLLVPLTLMEMILSKTEIPVSVLRILRPLLRGLRVLRIIVRGLGHGTAFKQSVRRRVAGQRLRYTKDGFDLDLAYIGKGKEKQVIATSIPAMGYEALYRNSMTDLAKFLNERHTNRYLLINLTEERRYPLEPFFHRYLECPIALNGVPSMRQTWELCQTIQAWLSLDRTHVVCIHSKNGRGRVGMLVSAYFLYLGMFKSAATSIAFFERCRVSEETKARSDEAAHPKSVDTPSQSRFVEYFSKLIKARDKFGRERVRDLLEDPRTASLTSATIHGLPSTILKSLELKFHVHPLSNQSGIKTDADLNESAIVHMRPDTKIRSGGREDTKNLANTNPSRSKLSVRDVGKALNRLTSMTGQQGSERADMAIVGTSSSKESRASEVKVPPRRSARHQALMARIQTELETSCYDTIQSGGEPETGVPVVTTRNPARGLREVTDHRQINDGADGRPEGWVGVTSRDIIDEAITFSFEGVAVKGEVKLELHCNAAHISGGIQQGAEEKTGRVASVKKKVGSGLRRLFGRKEETLPWGSAQGDDDDDAAVEPKDQQMLLYCWLHTDFLDRHTTTMSSVKETVEERSGAPALVVLRRFDMDKAAFAPKLWSYSTSFEVELEFQYEFRDNIAEGMEEGDEVMNLLGLAEFDSVPAAKMSWVNWCIRRLWPHCEPALRNILLETIMPMMNEFIPGALRPVSLKDFSLGSSHPILGPLMIAHKSGHDPDLQLDCVLNWEGDVTAILDVAGYAQVGISKVIVKGIICLKLRPFIDHIPVVGGVEVFFLNAPDIDLKFAGQLELANMSLLRPAINDAVKSAVAKKLVLPNIIQVDIQPESRKRGDPMISFRDVAPIAILRVKVMEASRLRGADWSLWSRTRTSDPYCVLQFGASKQSTRVIEKTTEPVWNETFDMLLHDWKQSLTVSIYDYDFGKHDDLLGRVKAMPCLTLLSAAVQGLWVPLEDVPQDGDGVPIDSQVLLSAEVFQFNRQKQDFDQLKEDIRNNSIATGVTLDEHSEAAMSEKKGKGLDCSTAKTCAQPCPDPFAPSRTRTLHLLDRQVEEGSEGLGPVALFTFRVTAAQIPTALVPHTTDAVVQVMCGKAVVSRNVTGKKYSSVANMSSEVQGIIESLAKSRLSSREIRDILNEDGPSVQRLIEKGQGFNAEIQTRMHLLVTLDDLAQAKDKLSFAIKVKNNVVAAGSMPLSHFGHAANLEAGQLVKCHSTSLRERETASLDVDASLAVLGAFDLEHIREMASQVGDDQSYPRNRMATSSSHNSNAGPVHLASTSSTNPGRVRSGALSSQASALPPQASAAGSVATAGSSCNPWTLKAPWSACAVRAAGDQEEADITVEEHMSARVPSALDDLKIALPAVAESVTEAESPDTRDRI